MELRRIDLLVLAVAAFTAAWTPLLGQTSQESPANPYKVRAIAEKPAPRPFVVHSGAANQAAPIEFRTPGQMTQKDRDVEADGEASIRERVSIAGLEFNEGKWSYQQIVCPALPNHVLLKFMRNNGKGDESVFTASIPRMGDGRVRIIPVLRRGYSLFSPAPVNALTISAFNHIRAEEHDAAPSDWLTTGMCYAALAGAHPLAVLEADDTEAQSFPSGVLATLEEPVAGGAIVKFLDIAPQPQPMEWTMIFDGKGKLLKATHIPAPAIRPRIIQLPTVEIKGTPLPSTVMAADGTQMP